MYLGFNEKKLKIIDGLREMERSKKVWEISVSRQVVLR